MELSELLAYTKTLIVVIIKISVNLIYMDKCTVVKKIGRIEALHPKKLKPTIQDIYAHARNLCGRMKMKFFDAEAIIITLLIIHHYI